MLFHHENLLRQNQLYRREMMRSAERQRLAHLVTRGSRHALLHPLMVWAGRRLVRAGLSLLSMADRPKVEARAVPYRQVY